MKREMKNLNGSDGNDNLPTEGEQEILKQECNQPDESDVAALNPIDSTIMCLIMIVFVAFVLYVIWGIGWASCKVISHIVHLF